MSRYDFKSPRLFVRSPLAAGMRVDLEPMQVNYLLNVLRLKPGRFVLVFNGGDGEWRAELVESGRRRTALEPVEQVRPQTPRPGLLYGFAPLKHARLDYMVQKAVEMGAGVLQPVLTRHGQVARLNRARMEANAIEAAEQCGILTVPEIRDPAPLEAFLAGFSGRLIFCDEAEETAPLAALGSVEGGPLAVLIGPEGGFSDEERAMLRAQPFVTAIGLGPRILRADTAAVAALALVQAARGDWR